MAALVKVKTEDGLQEIRVFGLRGAHLFGMFARTENAKQFRRWVLDVVDNYQVESIERYSKYQQLLHVYSNRRAHVSSCAREMAHWKQEKRPLESTPIVTPRFGGFFYSSFTQPGPKYAEKPVVNLPAGLAVSSFLGR